MRCPYCNNVDTQVKDSRPSEDGTTIRRRRSCSGCESRFTTFERVQLRELTVIKKDGTKRAFDFDKVIRSIAIATRKRPVTDEQVEMTANKIVRDLEMVGSNEIKVEQIGKAIMAALHLLDKVAYIRFASVYKDFKDSGDFEEFISNL